MTTRAQIERVIEQYAKVPREQLPGWMKSPDTVEEFDLAISVEFAVDMPQVTPVYNEADVLVGWSGVRMRA